MLHVSYGGTVRRAAHVLLESHGAGSAGEAAARADEHFANIDLGGFAFWKSVEKRIQQTQRVSAL